MSNHVIHHVKAQKEDIFEILQLYFKNQKEEHDPLFTRVDRLEENLFDPRSYWQLTLVRGKVVGLIAAMIDPGQKLAKITRMIFDDSIPDAGTITKAALIDLLAKLKDQDPLLDVVYTTTITMSMNQQKLTIDIGFKVLGIFPNLLGEDASLLNGMTAYFYPDVLEKKRKDEFVLHPTIAPFFNIAAKQASLEPLKVAKVEDVKKLTGSYVKRGFHDLPELEIIQAERFVSRRLTKHMQNRSQLVNFYPFYKPNLLICDPDMDLQVYVRANKKMKFAAIIGEHLKKSFDPIQIYSNVQKELRKYGISYMEIINDAADLFGVECILASGFTPCAYLPAFKLQGSTRRDYVIFAKSFEYICQPQLSLHPAYLDFYREYFRIEGKNYFPLEST